MFVSDTIHSREVAALHINAPEIESVEKTWSNRQNNYAKDQVHISLT